MKFLTKFVLVVGLQVLCLVGMIGYKYISLASGTEILLEVPRPKDPRSLFRGDYVIVGFAINDLDLKRIPSDFDIEDLSDLEGETIYVELKQKGDIWAPKKVLVEKPEEGVLFIKGKVISTESNRLKAEYGIEQYFVPEGTGLEMENRLRKVLKARVSIDPMGNATFVSVPEE